MNHPTSLQQVKEYDSQVNTLLLKLLEKVFTGRGIGFDYIDDTKDMLSTKKNSFVQEDTDEQDVVEPKNEMITMFKEGLFPFEANLPPVIIPTQPTMDSGVPYLKVSVKSWLNNDEAKVLPHALLNLLQSISIRE